MKLLRHLSLALAGMALVPAFAAAPKLAVGGYHMLLLKTDGTVWSWGWDAYGSLGNGTGTTGTPTQVAGLSGVVDVAAYDELSMALKADGTVWTWGSGGNGSVVTQTSKVPVYVPGILQAMSIAASFGNHTAFATDTSGNAWSWGNADLLGYASANATNTVPKQIPNIGNIAKIVAGNTNVIALRTDGTLLGWGDNDKNFNELGTGVYGTGTAPSPVSLIANAASDIATATSNSPGMHYALGSGGSVLVWGDTNSGYITCGQSRASDLPQPMSAAVSLSGLSGVTAMQGGDSFALFLTQAGAVYGCGYNGNGELGDGTTASVSATAPVKAGPIAVSGLPTIVAIGAGGGAAGAIATNGDVYTWGRRGSGQSGEGSSSLSGNNTTPVKIDIAAGALASAGPVYAGTQTGSIDNVTIDAGLGIAPAHIGAQGQIYLVIVLPNNGGLYLLTANGLAPLDATHTAILPAFSGTLPRHYPVRLASSLDLRGLAGTYVLMGYGLGSGDTATNDMLSAQRYGVTVTLQ